MKNKTLLYKSGETLCCDSICRGCGNIVSTIDELDNIFDKDKHTHYSTYRGEKVKMVDGTKAIAFMVQHCESCRTQIITVFNDEFNIEG